MKVGDKVYCIAEYTSLSLTSKFEVGKFYTIEYIVDFYRGDYRTYFASMNNISFSLWDKPFSRKFSEYFISNTDYRKLKLEQINNKIKHGNL